MQTSLDLKQLQYQMEHEMRMERQPQQEEEWAGNNEGGDDNFKVVIRVRPPLPRELQGFREYQCTTMVEARSGETITISENLPAVLNNQAAADGLLYATYR
eukprot:GHUV01040209.1.p2 GENE.GHUV01040209.1~~GHUV01040209.1.p2  ORF type:complete len:101 (+),score=24.32 GHUV01040209.1:766-1068(+)